MASSVACGAGFEAENFIDSVRILASQADSPFAQPGQTVHLQVLAYDGRQIRPEPMKVWWLPLVCINPADDAYYSCFAGLTGGSSGSAGGDAGPDAGQNPLMAADGGSASGLALPPGVDLSPYLVAGATFTMTLPPDIISSHVLSEAEQESTTSEPYGLAIAFNIACAGHVELVPIDPTSDNPIQVPVGCFDENENQLGPDDYVIGFTRVYAYNTWTTTNPVIQELEFDGGAVTDAGVAVPHCTATKLQDCTAYSLDTVVTPDSWVIDPTASGPGGAQRHVEIWVDYFTTQGILDDDARLLYDPVLGMQSGTSTNYHSPQASGPALLWAVAHNNLGGASWQQVAVQVQ